MLSMVIMEQRKQDNIEKNRKNSDMPENSNNINASKSKKRKWLILNEKLEIIELHEKGASYAKIAYEKGMNESSTLIKKKDQIKKHGTSTASYMTAIRHRNPIMDDMECLLMMWIEDCNQKRIPLNQMLIQAKAISLYNKLKENEDEVREKETFSASRGWFYNFRKRMGLHNV
jgi:Tc5 transposase DNA-binding domain/CENP-B N-terminal DNA-binding domain